ncbi:MAG: hypothetical protein L7U87_07760 [Chlamydiales bacterium]|nr:hypothetical protein [Chlamydiales bacterium]
MAIQAYSKNNNYLQFSSLYPATSVTGVYNVLFTSYFHFIGGQTSPKGAPLKNRIRVLNTVSLGTSLLNIVYAKSRRERSVSILFAAYSAYNLITISSSTPPTS